jgi:hypothetical protein
LVSFTGGDDFICLVVGLSAMQKWEYLSFAAVVDESLSNHLNAVGDAGWEVISIVEAGVAGTPAVHWVVCKRPLNQAFHGAT